ncbi:MAG: hypothetical protein FWG16_05570, partial [Micrococcales bacterium]|nr:hypothetical protein [Micrococcales bacterium]
PVLAGCGVERMAEQDSVEVPAGSGEPTSEKTQEPAINAEEPGEDLSPFPYERDDFLPCLRLNEYMEPIWLDGQSIELVQMADQVNAVLWDNSDLTSGSVMCTQNDGIAVFVLPGADGLRNKLEAIADDYLDYELYFFEVAHSLDQLNEMMDIITKDTAASIITGVAVDTLSGGLVIDVESLDDFEAVSNYLVREIGEGVPTIFRGEGVSHAAITV